MAVLVASPLLYGGVLMPGGSSGALATTWDTTHGLHAAFTNANLTALHTGGGNNDLAAHSLAGTTSSQKAYVELTIVQSTFGVSVGSTSGSGTPSDRQIGSSVSPSTGFLFRQDGVFLCLDSADHGGSFTPSYTTGDRMDMAFDTGTGKVWARKNGGAWNASAAGTQNPATGQGGAAVPFAGPYYIGFGSDAVDGDGVTAAFASISWAGTAPSGFTQINA